MDNPPPLSIAVTSVRVWDPLVRLLHWGLALAFLVAWTSAEDFMNVHLAAGLTIIAIIGVRSLWGLVGSRHARFDDFVPTPAGIGPYLLAMTRRTARRFLGHNPAGGAMALALWSILLATAALGLLTHFPPSGWQRYTEVMEDAHEILANIALGLVALHVTGVLISSLLHRENLPLSMLTGRKRPL